MGFYIQEIFTRRSIAPRVRVGPTKDCSRGRRTPAGKGTPPRHGLPRRVFQDSLNWAGTRPGRPRRHSQYNPVRKQTYRQQVWRDVRQAPGGTEGSADSGSGSTSGSPTLGASLAPLAGVPRGPPQPLGPPSRFHLPEVGAATALPGQQRSGPRQDGGPLGAQLLGRRLGSPFGPQRIPGGDGEATSRAGGGGKKRGREPSGSSCGLSTLAGLPPAASGCLGLGVGAGTRSPGVSPFVPPELAAGARAPRAVRCTCPAGWPCVFSGYNVSLQTLVAGLCQVFWGAPES